MAEAQGVVAENVDLPAGYSLAWSGQYEYMVRAKERLAAVGPLTLAVIVLLLFVNFGRLAEVAIVMGTLPLALVGGLWLLYLLGYQLSVDDGATWLYYDGGQWVEATGLGQYNDAATVDGNIASLPVAASPGIASTPPR